VADALRSRDRDDPTAPRARDLPRGASRRRSRSARSRRFGIALMATAAISSPGGRAPPILALTTTIVVVRFLALAAARAATSSASSRTISPPLARPYPRGVYGGIEPLAPPSWTLPAR
jgi:hypothetical protein